MNCIVIGKGKTASAITKYIQENTFINEFVHIVDDEFAKTKEESLSYFLKNSNKEKCFIVYGFADCERAQAMDRKIFHGYKTFFFSFPFCFNETGYYIDERFFMRTGKN